jgi:uncharacterized protein YllA (UPF0747 family)
MPPTSDNAENDVIRQGMKDFPALTNSELADYLRSEHISLAHLSKNAVRCRVERLRDEPGSVKVVTVRLPTGDVPGKLVGGKYVILL